MAICYALEYSLRNTAAVDLLKINIYNYIIMTQHCLASDLFNFYLEITTK